MVRIPVQEQTVGYSPTPLPMSSGEGYAAPGRAMQGLGQAIGGFGEAVASVATHEDDFNDKLKMLQFSNKVDLEDLKHREQFQGDPTGYTAQRADYFKQNEQDLYGGLSQKGQRQARLFVEQKRGSFLEGAQKFESHKRGELMVTNTDAAISSEVGKLNVLAAGLKPDEFSGALNDTITGTNAIIESAPIDEMKKQHLRDKAANQVKDALDAYYGKHPTEATSRETAGAMIKMWQQKAQQIGPQSNAGGAAPNLGPGVIAAVTDQSERPINKSTGYGDTVTGKITVNGNTYDFVNGGSKRGSIPFSTYEVKRFTSGDQRAQEGFSYTKDAFELSDIHDDAPSAAKGDDRRGLLIHDGNRGVTAGCIGIKGNFQQFQKDMAAEIAKNGGKGVKLALGPQGNGGGGAQGQSGGVVDRSQHSNLSAADARTILGTVWAEVGDQFEKNPDVARAKLETIFNRAAARGQNPVDTATDSKYYPSSTLNKVGSIPDGAVQKLTPLLKEVLGGSNVSNYATGNASGTVGFAGGKQTYQAPGTYERFGVEGPDQKWADEARARSSSGGGKPGLTQVAGLKIPGTANDAGPEGSPQGKGSVANPAPPLDPEALKTSALTAFKAATGKDLPQAQQVASPDGKTGGLSKGQGVTVDTTGMTPEEKTAAVKALGEAGYKGFHIAPMSSGDEHVTAYPSDGFKYTGAGAKEGKGEGPVWAKETFAGLRDQPSKGTQVAEAGRPANTIPLKPSVYSSLTRVFNDSMKTFAERDRAVATTMVDRFDKNAKEGIPIPAEELAAAQKAVQSVNDPALAQKLAKTVLQTHVTAQFQQMRPDQIQAVIGDATSRMKVNGGSPEQIAQIDALQKLHGTVNGALDKDMLSWGVKTAQIPALTPINPKVPESMSADALMMRAQSARHLAQVYQREPQFFTPDEKELLLEHYKQGGPALIKTMQGMADAFGKDTPLAMKAFGKDAPEAATLGVLIANGANPQVIKDIAYGLHLRSADPKFKEPDDKGTKYDQQRATLNGAFILNADAEKNAVNAANLAYMVRMHSKNKDPKTLDSEEFKGALNQVMGENEANGNKYGGLYQQGGAFSDQYRQPILVPANIKQDAVPKLVDALRVEDLAPNAQLIAPGAMYAKAPKMTDEQTAAVERAAETAKMTGAGMMTGFDPKTGAGNQVLNAAEITKGMPIDDKGRPLSMKVLRAATLVSVGDGKYMLATGDPKGDEPQWVNEAGKGGGDRRFILDLHKLEPVLKQRVPDAYRQD